MKLDLLTNATNLDDVIRPKLVLVVSYYSSTAAVTAAIILQRYHVKTIIVRNEIMLATEYWELTLLKKLQRTP
jgi:hypothetical protein